MYQDTDSDVAEQRDCVKVKVKWTQEEVMPQPVYVIYNVFNSVEEKKCFYRTADKNMLISLCLQDDKLKVLVQQLGTSDWKYIASVIPVSYLSCHSVYVATSCQQ